MGTEARRRYRLLHHLACTSSLPTPPPPGVHGMWRNAARASRYQGHLVSRPTCLAPNPCAAAERLPCVTGSRRRCWRRPSWPARLRRRRWPTLATRGPWASWARPQATWRSAECDSGWSGTYATWGSNPGLADRVPGRSWSATHTCGPRLGQPIGRAVLQDRPLISSETMPLAYLESLPAESFGATYGRSNPNPNRSPNLNPDPNPNPNPSPNPNPNPDPSQAPPTAASCASTTSRQTAATPSSSSTTPTSPT